MKRFPAAHSDLIPCKFFFLGGDSPASDLYMPTFRNTLSVPSSKAGVKFFFFAGLCEVGCLPVITKQQLIRDSCLCQFCLRKFF